MTRFNPAALGAVCALTLGLAGAAQAHVVLNPPEAPAGAGYTGAFRVGHGCAGAATTSLRVEFPPETTGVKPQAKAGWAVEIEREPLAMPVGGEGGRLVSERVKAVTWRGKLPDDEFDEFAVTLRTPAAPGPLYFTAVQACDTVVESWKDRPAPGQTSKDLARPAPMLRFVASASGSPPASPAPRPPASKVRPASKASASAAPAIPAEVKLVDGALVTASGAPLYVFKHDTMVGMSHCEGECATAWPPLLAPAAAKAPKDWSKVPRMDGSEQWAVQDHPLYTSTRTGDALKEAVGAEGSWTPARVSAAK